MGQGISQDQLAAHLNRQEELIRQLQAVVDKQAKTLESVGSVANDYDVDGHDEVALDDDLDEEIGGLTRLARDAERKRPTEDEVDEYEKQNPNEEWEATEEEERGFMSIKPWLGAMARPTGFEFGKTDGMPDKKLELQHVYGYRSSKIRSNVCWVDKKTIVYFAAAVGIVHDIEANTQKFFRGHTDDIISIDYHPQSRLVVTGGQGRTPAIYVWDVDSCQERAKLGGFHRRAVVDVAFSQDGTRVASVGLDDNHSVAVYDWASGDMIASDKGDTNRILAITFNKTAAADPNNQFITVGVKHSKFWTIESNGSLDQDKGLIGSLGTRQAFLSVACTPAYTVIGTQKGELYLFKGRKLSKIIPAHSRSVFALAVSGDSLYSGGRDGFVAQFDATTFKKRSSHNLNKVEPQEVLETTTNFVRALSVNADNGDLAVGTLTSSIYRISAANNEITPVMKAHYGDLNARHNYGELWGIHAAPTGDLFLTAGEDATLRLWNAKTRTEVKRIPLPKPAQCVAWSPNGKQIAVGLHSGQVMIFDEEGNEEAGITKCRRRIQSIKFSPNSKLLAAGSADTCIDVYDAENDYKHLAKMTSPSSVVLKLDFSADSKYLQICSQAYELLFFDMETFKHHTRSRELKDTEWATFSSILGWDVQGIWPKESDGSDVNSVSRSRSGSLLATAEDTGLVKLFNYPCVGGGLNKQGLLTRRPESDRASGHSSHVTEVTWMDGDKTLLSSGGGDLCVFQWKVVPRE